MKNLNKWIAVLMILVLMFVFASSAMACEYRLWSTDGVAESFNGALRTCYYMGCEDMDLANAFMRQHQVTATNSKRSYETNVYANADGTRLDITSNCITVEIPYSISNHADGIMWWFMMSMCSEITVDDTGDMDFTYSTYYQNDHFSTNRTTFDGGIRYITFIYK